MFPLKDSTRRDFLKSVTLTSVGLLARRSLAGESSSALPAVEKDSSTRLLDGWEHHRGALGSVWDVWREDSGNDITWQLVAMPHCFDARDAVDPDGMFYEGPAWYRVKLQVANPFHNGRTILHFEGAGQKSEVFVFLDKLGQHFGGYDEFVVDISESAAKVLKDPKANGRVRLAVLCDNSRDSETVPSSLNDFHRYGGLYRYVNLVYLPAISLERIHIDSVLPAKRRAAVSVRARLYNPVSLVGRVQIQIRILDPKGTVIYSSAVASAVWTGEQQIASFEVNDPELWSPSNPALYRCEATFMSEHGSMVVTERFGLRYFDMLPHGPFQLNGERLLLRGTQREEDHSGLGPAMTDDLISRELKLIKEMGANFLGLAHHQQSRRVLDLCDELGLLVLEEVPWSRGGIGGESYKQEVRDMLGAMIDQHYNHPSVFVWGLGNENDWPGDFPEFDRGKIRAFVKELNDQVHALDKTRKTFIRRCDFCKDLVDVYSPSIWAGWYHGPYTNYKLVSQKEMGRVNHFLHLEWGGESHAGRHAEDPDRFLATFAAGQFNGHDADYLLNGGQDKASEKGDWSETYVCNLFDWHLKEQENMPWLTGTAQWIFKDFSTPLRPGNPVPYVNQKGLAERDLTLKEGYYVFQSYWTDKPMIHIYGHSWPIRWGDPDEQKLVKVYSNCETAELFLNNVSCGEKRRNPQNFPAAGLHWLVRFVAGENHLRAVGRRNGTSVVDEVRFQYQTEKWGSPARVELSELARSGEAITVETRLFDAKNVCCLDARNRVHFGLTGDGILIDDTGTSKGSRNVELYNGRAEISFLTNGGKSVVSLSTEGIPTAFLSVT
jgi:beta-galactosidase